MTDPLDAEIRSRLAILADGVRRDAESVQSPAGAAVFQQLFDAVQSTLQNMKELSADEPAD